MVVAFHLERAPAYHVASIVRVGPWKEENLKTEFGELTRWARRHRVRTGRWIFLERSHTRWEACLQIQGHPRPEGRIRLKTLPAAWAATVTFDPETVSSSIVYHGLHGWTRSRRRAGHLTSVTGIREIYPGDPWTDRRAWAQCRVEFLVRK